MQLSVVILNYNVRYFLELCLSSVQQAIQGIDAEIIVVDNNSADDSCAMVLEKFPSVILIQNHENTGFPKGNNIGVAAAKGKYICILNPDTVVAEDTFTQVLNYASKQQNLGIVGVQLIDGSGSFLPESKRGIPTPWVSFTKITSLYKIFPKSNFFGKYYAPHLDKNTSGAVDILVGAFMMMRRDLYLEVGGFDINCFMYMDDVDLSYSILNLKKSNFYFADSKVIHFKGESTTKDFKFMQTFRQAMTFFYEKHFKVSWFFDVFMRIGILFYSFFKKNKKEKQKQPKVIETFVYCSNNENLFREIQNNFKEKVSLFNLNINDFNAINFEITKKTKALILDANILSYKSIINLMDVNKNKGYQFFILPKNADFIIGSSNANDKGRVIKWNNEKD
jgi:GT2 family glycosyltransferase